MDKILNVFQVIFTWIFHHASNICLTIGSLLVLRHIWIQFGFDSAMLTVGIVLIFASVVIAINER